ncbi:hypothetical protein SAMN04488027_11220 [Psychroflexus sediminis]|uniref:Uncharacterized protein n=1 Tax=Psychroflexus sediminis TaxID=470826 RepID=A0A1G7YF91_9FLAO|nr:hypothetical protein SAMN04488027_11220 [Psychroflexus sediminis]
MKIKYLFYTLLAIILLIQVFDKNDEFLILQYLLLAIIVIALILKLIKKSKKE